jgi:dTDP-4-amino-4,6-dideoxygalactose transaminase
MIVPFLDLSQQHAGIRPEIDRAIAAVIDSGVFAGGPAVAGFEAEFAAFCGCSHGIGVGSGTEALWLALVALGVEPGDEVITAPNSFIATAEAITWAGARPVFVDVDPATCNLDPSLLEAAITERTRAIIPVHLYGQCADMDPILEIARSRGLAIIEDACQAHGAEYKGERAGSLGDVGCFSFYPGKNLGALGDAGAVVTNDAALAEKIRVLRDHGQVRKYHHSCIGWNARMDGIQAAVLSVKLRRLDEGNALRRGHAAFYDQAFAGHREIIPPAVLAGNTHVYHLYTVRVPDRDSVIRSLSEEGIGFGIHYPLPIHLQEAYRSLGHQPGAFPHAEEAASSLLSLPMFPELTSAQLNLVAQTLRQAVAERDAAPIRRHASVTFSSNEAAISSTTSR